MSWRLSGHVDISGGSSLSWEYSYDLDDTITVYIETPSPASFSDRDEAHKHFSRVFQGAVVPWIASTEKDYWLIDLDTLANSMPANSKVPSWMHGTAPVYPAIRPRDGFWGKLVRDVTREATHAHLLTMLISDALIRAVRNRLTETDSSEGTNVADVVYICALHKPELARLMDAYGIAWSKLPTSSDDPHAYHSGVWTTNEKTALRIVAAAQNQMGMASAAVLATKMILRFRPRLVVMVGIAAGAKEDAQGFGDILCAEHTYDYGSGKLNRVDRKVEFVPDPKPLDTDHKLVTHLKGWEASERHLNEVEREWPLYPTPSRLRLHVGPIASGAAVLNDAQPIRDATQHWRKLLGIDMEAYGVHRACNDSIRPAPMFLCMKSVCDFAHQKADDWQQYAAFTSARISLRFLRDEWEQLFPESIAERRGSRA